jgi:hypothetical protein
MVYQVDHGLSLPKYPVLLVHLPMMVSVLCTKLAMEGISTSSSLKAARLFKPCTLASFVNLSRDCRVCHLPDEEPKRVPGSVDARVLDDLIRCVWTWHVEAMRTGVSRRIELVKVRMICRGSIGRFGVLDIHVFALPIYLFSEYHLYHTFTADFH